MTMSYDEIRDDVSAQLFTSVAGWPILFHDEELIVDSTMELMAAAYDEAFRDCEYQDSGFAGTTGWTNNNPYRKARNA